MEPTQNGPLNSVDATSGEPRSPVMIVDSEPTFARVLQAYLALQGWSARVCSPREATRDVSELQPCAIVLDFDGQGVDGFDLLEALSAADGGSPILVCSHHAEPTGAERDNLRELGVARWLHRPCALDAIAAALQELLDPQRSYQQRLRVPA
jgi:DNA-binding response OmpR family regulator